MEHIDTAIIGAGQAGLSVGYHLSRLGRPAVILEANDRVGDSWRRRWDSLRLFTPARFSSLPGMPFPADPWSFPTREQMGNYLEAYADRFSLPVRCGARVQSLSRQEPGFVVRTDAQTYAVNNIVVASGPHQERRVPSFAAELDPSIRQMHSIEYRNAAQVQPGGVVVVGAGNSGTDIALELAREHEVWLSGRHPGQLPFAIDGRTARLLLPVIFFAFRHVLTVRTPLGRSARRHALAHSSPLIRNRIANLDAAGVHRVSRTVGVRDGQPTLEDGQVLPVRNVIWCTGFDNQPAWIGLRVFGAEGEPEQFRGVAANEPGLYFLGREFMYALSSVMIQGAGRDAEYVARHIDTNSPTVSVGSPTSAAEDARAGRANS
jgi:putative flavoprotein involved in K+ transport